MPATTSTPSWLAKEKRTYSMPNMSSHLKHEEKEGSKRSEGRFRGQKSKRPRVVSEQLAQPLQPTPIPKARRSRPGQKLRKAILPPSTPCSPCTQLPASPSCASTFSEWSEHETQAFAELRRETSEADFSFVRSMQRWEHSQSYATSCPSLSPDPSVSEVEMDQEQEVLCDEEDLEGDDVQFVLDMGDSESNGVSELPSSPELSPTTSVSSISSASSCISDFGPSSYIQQKDEVDWLAARFSGAKLDWSEN